MPSPLIVPVATISAITPHPNAESLEIARVLGWQVMVRKGEYSVGAKVIFFPVDTVLPKELSDSIGVTSYLDRGRIRAVRLRGEPSFGLVIAAPHDVSIGDNVAERYGVTKYEPPTREAVQRGQGKVIPNPFAVPRNPLLAEYTHIANLRLYPDVLGPDELVVVTEKLHGTNSRIGMIDGEWVAGSHRVQRGEADALYWSPRKHVEALVTALAKRHRQVIVYGEIVGSDVQSLDYGYKGYEGYAAFDVMVDGRYLDYHAFQNVCSSYGVPMVPLVIIDRFSLDTARHYSKGETAFGPVIISEGRGKPPHLREGVVVKPVIERSDPRVGRVVLKFISDDYLLGKQSDFAEV